VLAEHRAQRRVQQVRGRVIEAVFWRRSLSMLAFERIAHAQRTLEHAHVVQVMALGLAGVASPRRTLVRAEITVSPTWPPDSA
jgi:hypothetical protein